MVVQHGIIPCMVRLGLGMGLCLGGLLAPVAPAFSAAIHSAWLHIGLPNRTVHNSHYLAASFLYELQTFLGTEASSPKVLDGKIVRRQGKELYIDLDQVPAHKA